MRPRGRFELASDRPWRFELLTPPETGRRNRRTIDGALILAGAVVVGGAAAIASSAPDQDEAVGASLVTVFGWAVAVWRAAFLGALLLALTIVVVTVVQRRWGLARDLGLALLLVTGAGLVLGGLVESDWFVIEPHLWSQWGFPELRVAWLAAIVTVAGPELVRPVRILADWLVAFAAFGLSPSVPRFRQVPWRLWRSVSAAEHSSVCSSEQPRGYRPRSRFELR